MFFPFIPYQLTQAPVDSELQLPSLLLRKVFLDRNSSFQVWSPKSDAILTTAEAGLLKVDRFRVEAICSRLVSLLGATCSEYEEHLLTSQKIFDSWEDVKYFASKYRFNPNAIDVLFSSQTIRPLEISPVEDSIQWVVEPACWEVFFLKLSPVERGYQILARPNNYLSVIIWTGQPTIKSMPKMRSRNLP